MGNVIIFVKGMILGLANVIPGVSGGTLAITLGLYEKIIHAVTHFFSDFKNNIKLLIPLILGAVIAILALSKVIDYSLENHEIETVMLFGGLILGGLPLLFKKVKGKKVKSQHIATFVLTFAVIILLSILNPGDAVASLDVISLKNIVLLFLVGVIAAATMVIPGISGSFVLMLLGFYKPIIETISSLTSFTNVGHNLIVLGVFGVGVLVGIFVVAKIIEYLLEKKETLTYYAILGFVTSSIVGIFMPLSGYNLTNISVGAVLLFLGYFISYQLAKLK